MQNLKSETSDSHAVTRSSGSNFVMAFRFLPKENRKALSTFYAFSRIIDDCVDEPKTKPEKRASLDYWKTELSKMDGGSPDSPIMRELQAVVTRYKIPKEYLHGIIQGCEMDIEKNRYQTMEDLQDYCYHVAGLVGLTCLKIFEYESPTARDMAINLGLAFQLTNIIRDVQTDLAMDRIYFPLSEFKKFGYTEQDLIQGIENKNFFSLLEAMTQKAESHYQMASIEFAKDTEGKLKTARIMASVYHMLLRKIRRKNYPVFRERVSLNCFEKLFALVIRRV